MRYVGFPTSRNPQFFTPYLDGLRLTAQPPELNLPQVATGTYYSPPQLATSFGMCTPVK